MVAKYQNLNPSAQKKVHSNARKDALSKALENTNHSFFIFSDSLSRLPSLNSTKSATKTNLCILQIKDK